MLCALFSVLSAGVRRYGSGVNDLAFQRTVGKCRSMQVLAFVQSLIHLFSFSLLLFLCFFCFSVSSVFSVISVISVISVFSVISFATFEVVDALGVDSRYVELCFWSYRC